jgi:ubiquinone/menaquinone biosynthesis C-methylase UbiE
VTAVDISQEMLDVFQEKVKNLPEAGRNLNIICLDIDSFLDREELSSYDCVTIHSVLHHLPHYSDTIRRVSKLLSNGGLIYISHEPLQKKKDIAAHVSRFLEKVDSIPLRLWMLFHRITPREHSFSDYHVQTGIDDKQLSNLLSDCGFEIIVCRKYTPWKTKFIDILARLMHIRPTCFKLLARKRCQRIIVTD